MVGRLLDGDTSAQESEDIAAEVQQAIDSMAFNGQMSDETADRIIKRIDDLENSLPNKVAGELQR